MRPDRRPHNGQGAVRERGRRVRVMAGRAGSIAQVSSRTEAGSGDERVSRFTPRIWRPRPDHQNWPRANIYAVHGDINRDSAISIASETPKQPELRQASVSD